MSNTAPTSNEPTDWEGIVVIILLFVLIVLCAGKPDLLDAIIAYIGRQP